MRAETQSFNELLRRPSAILMLTKLVRAPTSFDAEHDQLQLVICSHLNEHLCQIVPEWVHHEFEELAYRLVKHDFTQIRVSFHLALQEPAAELGPRQSHRVQHQILHLADGEIFISLNRVLIPDQAELTEYLWHSQKFV